MDKEIMEALTDFSKVYHQVMDKLEDDSEKKWNALSKQDQLDYFCAVVRRIFKGEIEDKRSYRGVLYSVFEFGPEAYAPAQNAGYLAIHNAIYDAEHERDLLAAFAKTLGLTDQGAKESVENFYKDKFL